VRRREFADPPSRVRGDPPEHGLRNYPHERELSESPFIELTQTFRH
jgi:hypothetical protein